jgi:hypothetical protein
LNLSEKRPFFGLQLDIFCFLVAFCLALIGFSSSHDYRSSIELLYRCTHTILLSSLRAKALRTSFAHSSLRSSLFVCPSFASSLLYHRPCTRHYVPHPCPRINCVVPALVTMFLVHVLVYRAYSLRSTIYCSLHSHILCLVPRLMQVCGMNGPKGPSCVPHVRSKAPLLM